MNKCLHCGTENSRNIESPKELRLSELICTQKQQLLSMQDIVERNQILLQRLQQLKNSCKMCPRCNKETLRYVSTYLYECERCTSVFRYITEDRGLVPMVIGKDEDFYPDALVNIDTKIERIKKIIEGKNSAELFDLLISMLDEIQKCPNETFVNDLLRTIKNLLTPVNQYVIPVKCRNKKQPEKECEALQWTGVNLAEVFAFVPGTTSLYCRSSRETIMSVPTSKGVYQAYQGFWIVKERYEPIDVMSHTLYKERYELIEE